MITSPEENGHDPVDRPLFVGQSSVVARILTPRYGSVKPEVGLYAQQRPDGPPTRVAGANGTAGSTTAAVINQTGWWGGYGYTRDTPGMLFTAGIVPDRVTSVTVHLVGGTTIPLPVQDNVFLGDIHAATSSVAGQGAAHPSP